MREKWQLGSYFVILVYFSSAVLHAFVQNNLKETEFQEQNFAYVVGNERPTINFIYYIK